MYFSYEEINQAYRLVRWQRPELYGRLFRAEVKRVLYGGKNYKFYSPLTDIQLEAIEAQEATPKLSNKILELLVSNDRRLQIFARICLDMSDEQMEADRYGVKYETITQYIYQARKILRETY